MIEPSHLAAFVASRICHDLISPVASVNSALELLDEPGDAEMKLQAQQLLTTGAEAAAARIQLLRYAFGSAGLSDSGADRHEVKQIIEGFMQSYKPTVDWDIQTEHFSYSHARVLMNLLMMANSSIPRGGVIALRVYNAGNTLTASASGRGPRANLTEYTRAAIDGTTPQEGWSARTIQPLFAKIVIDELGGQLKAVEADESVTFIASELRAAG